MKIAWTLCAVAGIAMLVATPLTWAWGIRPDRAPIIGYSGLLLSVLGLYVSVVGFALAIHQILKSRSASEAAEQALHEVKAKLSTINATGEIERARFALEETERHIHDGRGKNVRFSISPARQSLVRIHELDMILFSDLKDQLKAAIDEMHVISNTPEPWEKDTSNRNSGLVRSYIDLMNRLQVRVSKG